jgi:hypothetical protein
LVIGFFLSLSAIRFGTHEHALAGIERCDDPVEVGIPHVSGFYKGIPGSEDQGYVAVIDLVIIIYITQ